ncbi:MAG: adenylyltransferase/cytidyltransferase family protein [Candidatus Peribacteraceae bacterium]|nr:adenylyltransferase/cytidyltransferase family protein [Candidatus Peribacteraceae bacterium]
MRKNIDTIGVLVGRFCPHHNGHTALINEMIHNHGHLGTLIVVGSANSPISENVPFTYKERTDMLRTIYPDIKIAGIPDFTGDDSLWLSFLDDVIKLTFRAMRRRRVYFYAGSIEDVEWYHKLGRDVVIVNRGTEGVSGTLIRERISQGKSVETLMDSRLNWVGDLFRKRIINIGE